MPRRPKIAWMDFPLLAPCMLSPVLKRGKIIPLFKTVGGRLSALSDTIFAPAAAADSGTAIAVDMSFGPQGFEIPRQTRMR